MRAAERAALREYKRIQKVIRGAKSESELRAAYIAIQKIEYDAEQLQIIQAREDPNAFIEYAFEDKEGNGLRQTPMHKAWQENIYHKEVFPEGHHRALIIAPRDHGKTSQIPIARVIWELGRNPNLRIKIVCASDSKSMERLFEIVDNLERNEKVQKVFPHLKPAERGTWSKHKIVVKRTIFSKDASVEALGVLSTATGGRADLLVADDIVDFRNGIQYPQLRETVKHSWRSDWVQLLEPDGRIVYICTLWHKADNSHVLMENAAYGSLFYAINAEMDGMECEYTSPKRDGKRERKQWQEPIMHTWSQQAFRDREEEIGSVEFNRGFRNRALSGDIAVVQDESIIYYKPEKLPRELAIYQGYDLAISKKAHADYFACVTIGIDPDTWTIYVIDAWRSRLSFIQQAEAVIQEYLTRKPEIQVMEATAYQESLPQYLDSLSGKPLDEVVTEPIWEETVSGSTTLEMVVGAEVVKKLGKVPLLPIFPVKPRIDKMSRLKRITPYMERGKILFSPKMEPRANADILHEKGNLVGELLNFPIGRHDDLMDAFVHVVSAVVRMEVETRDDADELDCGVRVIGV